MNDASQNKPTGGATIQQNQDPRVTSAAQWIANLLQGIVAIVLCFVANNLWQVNLTLAADAETKKAMLQAIAENRAHLQQHDGEIGQLQRDVAIIGGTQFRGPLREIQRGR